MALGNTKMQVILREYEHMRERNRNLLAQRRALVEEKAPAYFDYHRQLISLCMQHVNTSLYSEADQLSAAEYQSALSSLRTAKEQALINAGFPSDYLEPIYTCSKCRDTGFADHAQCECLKKRIIRELYAQSGIEHLLDKNNFSTLSYDYYEGADLEAFRSAVQACHHMISQFDTQKDSLLFTGTVGCGKSFLSGCVAKELMDLGFSVVYFSSSQIFDILYQNTLYNGHEDLYNYDLVIIDDLGSEVTNSVVTAGLFSFLNERILREKATIISTNLSLSELKDRYSERIVSRIIQNYKICKLSGPDIRIVQKRLSTRK